ncbi:MAG TPA: lysylphosphatidylglycerol synthase domain-containing protein [Phycisphaerales bacterium]|nr:lysylphosphatidylglycerol synthase domain-containing protein [Phycisphaerales bacterium]
MTRHSRSWAVLVVAAFLLAGGAIAFGMARAITDLQRAWGGPVSPSGWAAVIGACSLYVLAHLLRALRLVVMIQDERVGLRETFTAHFVAAGASLFIPFKLGEVFRVAEVARLLRSPVRALLLVWSERVLDLLAITGAMLVALIFRKDLFESAALGIFLTLAVVAGTFVAFLVMPEQLESVKLLLIRRYRGAWSLSAVRAVDASQRLLMHAPDAMKRRPTTLISLTAIIWTLEVASLALLLPAAAGAIGATLSATAFFFSQLFPGSMGPLKAILERVMPGSAVSPLTALYPSALYVVFLAASLAALLAALPTRLHELLRTLRSRSLASLPAWMRRPAPTTALGDAS